MKFKYKLITYSLFMAFVFSGCDGNNKNFAQIGLWYASGVSKSGCTNPALDGVASCPSDIDFGNTYSCIELHLRETSYTLNVRLDSNNTNEVGSYKLSDGNIQLCPTSPIGSCYDVPVANVSSESMIISLKRSTGCTAKVDLIKIR